MTRLEIRNIIALGGIFACRMLGLFMVLPVFSPYAQHLSDATPLLIGIALGGYGLTQALFQLPFGIWSDFVSRKKVIAIGLGIFAVGSVIAGLSHSIIGIIIGRAMQGIGAVGSTIIALAADLSQPQDRPKAMAIIGATIGLSFTLALILGPILMHWLTVPQLFLLTAAMTVVSLLILWRGVPNSPLAPTDTNLRALPERLKHIVQQPALLRLNGSILISHAILTALFVALPLHLAQHLHLASPQQWRLYLPALLAATLVIGGLLRRLRHTQQQSRYFRACVALISLSLLGFSYQPHTLWVTGIWLAVFFMAFTLLEALLPAMVSTLAPSDLRGTAIGLYSSCQFLGIFCGGAIGGELLGRYDTGGVFVSLLILSIFWWLLSWPKFELK